MTSATTMTGVYLTGHGGLDKLEYRNDIPVPKPADDEVLIQVMAAGINNTDINTRIGWYSKKVTTSTNEGGEEGFSEVDDDDASWSGAPLNFPRIQGADICGYIKAVGANIDSKRIGQRVLVRSMMQVPGSKERDYQCWTVGSELNGGFAQYAVAPSNETFEVNCDWSDAALASIPCAYSTAENLLHRVKLGDETVLITGASGGVGSAAVQLAKRRGATVIAVSSTAKAKEVLALGADKVIDRNADFVSELGDSSIDVVVDLVAGDNWPKLLEVLKRGGRYCTAGAIAGPLVELDVRTLYLKDLTLMGCTFQEQEVFTNLISYIERNEIKPVVARAYPLAEIAQAQEDFIAKAHTGKLVLIPPSVV